MKSMTAIFASPVAVAVASVMGAIVPAAAQQTSQDYLTLPGYSARPPGMCWHKHPGYDVNGYQGYWEACTNSSGNQSVNGVRAQGQSPRREQKRHR
jgi:hypothetical protein